VKDVLIIIPAYNEQESIRDVIESLKKYDYVNILVVDDGSTDRTFEIVNELNVYVAKHMINRGAGAASATGFEIAKIIGSDIVITFDADGQHDAADIVRLIEPIRKEEADVVIGSRMLAGLGMPFRRTIYNIIANVMTFILSGIFVSDTQSGLKAFNRKAYNLIDIETARMEFCSEIIHKIKKYNLRYREVKITSIYTDYSLSKGQGFIVGVKTLFRLLLSKLFSRG